MEFLIKNAKKVEFGYDMSSAILFADNSQSEEEIANSFHHVTDSGWRSTKKCIIDFQVLDTEGDLLIISEETAKQLLSNYTNGKLWRCPEKSKVSRNSGAWAYIMNNYVTDPHDNR